MNIIVRVPEGGAQAFIGSFTEALRDLQRVAVQGSDPDQVADASLNRFREFFRKPITEEENRRELGAWRRMTPDQQVAHERRARWDIANVLYMLEPSVREWSLAGCSVEGTDTVAIHVEDDENGASDGVIRQIVEYAGGTVTEEPAPEDKPIWAFWKR